MKTNPGPSTESVHGQRVHSFDGHGVVQPVVQSATFAFENTAALVAHMEGRVERDEYGRYGNPTTRYTEAKLAALEHGEAAALFGSGMAALTTTLLTLGKAGSHVVLFDDCYRRTRQFVGQFLERFGVSSTLVPAADLGAFEAALTPSTRVCVVEAPSNPYQTVPDLPALTTLCRSKRIKTIVDATFATPINLRPLDHGADLVVHSATKYLAGHNDVLAGAVVGSDALISLVRQSRDVLGGVLDPHAAYLVDRGLKTLALRVERQNATGLSIAQTLEKHPRVRRVWYPGLASHPNHDVARRLMKGFGGVVTFELDADLEGTSRFIDACRIPRIAPSLGGVDSLIEQPALMSYFELDAEARRAVGIGESLVRFAAGIEDEADLAADLLAALDASA